MAQARLRMPNDPNSEIFLDPLKLTVGFRPKSDRKLSATAPRSLRVVVQCFGGIVDDQYHAPGAILTAGADRKNVLRIPTRELPDFHPLLEYALDGSVRITFNKHFSGVVQAGEALRSLTEAATSSSGVLSVAVLPKGSRGAIEHGNVVLYFEEIITPEKLPPPPIFKSLMDDPYFRRWVLVSLALHVLVLFLMWMIPASPKEVKFEDLSTTAKEMIIDPNRFAKISLPSDSATIRGLSRGAVGQEGEGARAPGPEGRRGKGVPGSGAMSAQDIGKTGALAFFSKGNKGVLSDLLGGSAIPGQVDKSLGHTPRFGLPGERELKDGKGLAGTGTGGGGPSTSIGPGLGTKGKGGGAKGPGLADFGTGRSNVAVSASIDEEDVIISGNISKEAIAKIINDHIGQIKWCYEKELQKQPGLRGKITTDFIIGLEGRVTRTMVKQTTMGSPPVEQCILGVLRTLQFPKPGGGMVEVIFPFLFRVAG